MNMHRFYDPNLVGRARMGLWGAGALAAALVLVAGLYLAYEQQRTIVDLQDRIDRVQALPKGGAASNDLFLAAESPNIAQTRLQTQIQDLAAAHALEIDVIRVTDVEDQGRTIALGILLNGIIPEDRLAGFLSALESATPKILLDNMDMRRARVTSRRDPTRKIALRLGLKGLMLK